MSSLLLTPEQRHIIGHTGKSILIGAVAGSGKTTTLAHSVAHRERQGMAAQDMLVLVFTHAAEQVFRQRLAQAGASRNVRVATYAAFARSLLAGWQQSGAIEGAQHYLASSEAVRPYLVDAVERASEARDADPEYAYDLSNLHAEIILNQLSRLKGTLDLRRFDLESDDELAESLDIPRGLVAICREFERQRYIDQGDYLFQSEADLVFDALSVLDALSDTLTLPQYALIVADEWHDANAGHLELLSRLATPQTRIIAAGDREQVIHSWNGADPRYMGEAYAARFPDTRYLPLTASFRCGATLSAGAQALTGQPFTSSRPTDTLVDLVAYEADTEDDCAAKLAQCIVTLVDGPRPVTLADCAVLLRDHHQSIAIENALIERAVPYATEGFTTYFNRIEVLMLRGILHVVHGTMAAVKIDPRAGQAQPDPRVRERQTAEIKGILRALGLFAGLQYSEREWQDAERTIVNQPDTLRDFFSGQLTRTQEGHDLPDATTTRWRERFAAVCAFLTGKADTWSAGQLLTHAAVELKIADTTRRLFVYKHQADAVAKSIAGFIAYATRTGLNTSDFLAALEQAQLRSGALHKSRHRLVLSTAREAKGKEWKHVLLPYLVNGEFPDARAEPGEERRLFYVAITRASEQLWLFTPTGHVNHFIHALRLDPKRHLRLRDTPDRTPLPPAIPQAPVRVYLNVPFEEKDAAKQLGAQWDNIQRKWWITPAMPTRLFKKWLPPVSDT